jgi:hypothetical protein
VEHLASGRRLRFRSTRLVPFTKETIAQLARVTVAPIAPVLLTMISLEAFLKRFDADPPLTTGGHGPACIGQRSYGDGHLFVV